MDFDEKSFRQFGWKLILAMQKKKMQMLMLTGKRLEGLMKARIFQQGKASDNSKIGKYKTPSWIKFRKLNNFQTSYVDLSVTQKLEHSIQPVVDGQDVVIRITRPKQALIMDGQETRNYKKEISTPTDGEVNQVTEYFEDILTDEFNKIVASL